MIRPLEFFQKVLNLENKKNLVVGDKEYDLLLRTKGKIGVQIGNKTIDLNKVINTSVEYTKVFPISSEDFVAGNYTYNYELDLKSFDGVSCSWKLSNLTSGDYFINITLLAGYDWKQYSLHIDVLNDTNASSTSKVNINFITLDTESKFGFAPIQTTFPGSMQAASRYFMFYYNPNLKYWFNPIF